MQTGDSAEDIFLCAMATSGLFDEVVAGEVLGHFWSTVKVPNPHMIRAQLLSLIQLP